MNQRLKLLPMAKVQFGTLYAAGIQRIQAIKLSCAPGPAEPARLWPEHPSPALKHA